MVTTTDNNTKKDNSTTVVYIGAPFASENYTPEPTKWTLKASLKAVAEFIVGFFESLPDPLYIPFWRAFYAFYLPAKRCCKAFTTNVYLSANQDYKAFADNLYHPAKQYWRTFIDNVYPPVKQRLNSINKRLYAGAYTLQLLAVRCRRALCLIRWKSPIYGRRATIYYALLLFVLAATIGGPLLSLIQAFFTLLRPNTTAGGGVITQMICLSIFGLALSIVCFRNVMHSLLALLGVFVATAFLFLSYSAEYLGTVVLIVYIGAVAILFLFIVMLIPVQDSPLLRTLITRQTDWIALSLVTLLVWVGEDRFETTISEFIAAQTSATSTINTDAFLQAIIEKHDVFTFISLYNEEAPLFLLITVLLLIAMVGAIVLATSPEVSGASATDASMRQIQLGFCSAFHHLHTDISFCAAQRIWASRHLSFVIATVQVTGDPQTARYWVLANSIASLAIVVACGVINPPGTVVGALVWCSSCFTGVYCASSACEGVFGINTASTLVADNQTSDLHAISDDWIVTTAEDMELIACYGTVACAVMCVLLMSLLFISMPFGVGTIFPHIACIQWNRIFQYSAAPSSGQPCSIVQELTSKLPVESLYQKLTEALPIAPALASLFLLSAVIYSLYKNSQKLNAVFTRARDLVVAMLIVTIIVSVSCISGNYAAAARVLLLTEFVKQQCCRANNTFLYLKNVKSRLRNSPHALIPQSCWHQLDQFQAHPISFLIIAICLLSNVIFVARTEPVIRLLVEPFFWCLPSFSAGVICSRVLSVVFHGVCPF